MFDPKQLTLSDLPSVAFDARQELPACRGVYFAVVPDGAVLYIGKAKNIGGRWRHHHRLVDLSRWPGVSISWLLFDGDDALLLEIERACIEHFAPLLNGSRIAFAGNVKRSFTLPQSLYERLERVASKEDRTVNAQVVRWIEQKVREYEAQQAREQENGSGQWMPELIAA